MSQQPPELYQLPPEEQKKCLQDQMIYGHYLIFIGTDGSRRRVPPEEFYKPAGQK